MMAQCGRTCLKELEKELIFVGLHERLNKVDVECYVITRNS
jgi:hypothetical protein